MSESIRTGTGGTGEKVKAETSATAGQAKQAASQLTGTAGEQARAVVGEARQQAGTAIGDLRGRAMGEAEEQTKRAAGTLRQWANDLSDLARRADSDSPARSLVTQAADKGHWAADYLDEQGVEGMVSDLRGFARRRPGAFLGGALVAGLVVGRLAKAAGSASRSDGAGEGQTAVTAGRGPVETPASSALPPGPPPAGPPPTAPPQAPAAPTGVRPTGAPVRPYPEV
ncbi:hypothetical protein [Streptomyces leeuwenhoekii]|uniref:Uncharacterized protein n=1 Tax=Streptomyces leeuwenhoekii TaxID=1437453 RepID=A0A0F7VM59_STRLW|nr:hypothetical protein [Streptomyces leeuwenhoekii]CQR60270.1 Hypothetical Protein Ndas [Streptomyces leeuwenhoekii]